MDDQQLISDLGIEDLSPEQQRQILEQLTMKIGEALAADLSEAQLQEFQGIIDEDTGVIEHFLQTNAPNYKETPLYEEISKDNGGVSVDKLYAYSVWLAINKPDYQQTVERIKADVKASIDQH